MHDGQRVSYVGDPSGDLQPGDEGRILSCASTGAHVKWASGDYSLVPLDLITPLGVGMSVESALDETLDFGGFTVISARDVFDNEGPDGLLNQMADAGHLASFERYAQDALDGIEASIRRDPSFMAVAAHLEESETEDLVRLASLVLMRDAFGFGEE